MKISPRILKGCLDTLIIVAMTTLPTIIACLAEKMRSRFTIQTHFLSGEFLLYSVSFFCATFLVFIERSGGQKDWKSYANGFILIGVAIISGFYGIMLTAEPLNSYIIKLVSVIALFISVPVFFYSQILNNTPPDIQQKRQNESQLIQDSIS